MSYQFSLKPVNVPHIQTLYRTIKTAIPAVGTEEISRTLQKFESRSMQGQMPIIWDSAEDFTIRDKRGNRWIDFTSTIFVANVGHANRHVANSVKSALDKPLVHNYAYMSEVRVNYIEKLVKFAGPHFEKAFLLSAGTEATEAALKLMRMHGQKIGKRKCGVICIEGNWHGRTMGAQLMCSNEQQKSWIGFTDPDIHFINFPYPWNCDPQNGEEFLQQSLDLLESKGVDLNMDVCGFMLETFQGWGAVFYPDSFVKAIERVCKDKGVLLAFDEMQAGFARTGKSFGYEHYGVKADLICCGKGMGSGFPLSGVIGNSEVMDLPEVGNMSSTHSANPLVCAAGLATLEEIERKNLIKESERKGNLMHSSLNNIKKDFASRISYVLGKGMIASILFKDPDSGLPEALFTSKVCERCMQKGLLVVHTGRESIKIGPPLTITDDALLEGISVLAEAITEISAEV